MKEGNGAVAGSIPFCSSCPALFPIDNIIKREISGDLEFLSLKWDLILSLLCTIFLIKKKVGETRDCS